MKLPKIPMNKKILKLSAICSLPKKTKAKPIKKEPNRFTINVPIGKPQAIYFIEYKETIKRNMAPILPPNAKYKNFIVLLFRQKYKFGF